MTFVQAIEITTSDIGAVQDHVAAWHAEQKGVAPGYQRARILSRADEPSSYVIDVEFTSKDEAEQNNARPETASWAQKLGELVTGSPVFTNYELVCTTD